MVEERTMLVDRIEYVLSEGEKGSVCNDCHLSKGCMCKIEIRKLCVKSAKLTQNWKRKDKSFRANMKRLKKEREDY